MRFPGGLLLLASLAAPTAALAPQHVGESLGIYDLAEGNAEVRGVAWDQRSPDAPRLLALDRSGKLFVYRPPGEGSDELELLSIHELPAPVRDALPAGPRGLSCGQVEGRTALFFLGWSTTGGAIRSQLWRWELADDAATAVDLTLHSFRIGEREVFDLAREDGGILVGFDATGYADGNLRVRRGILRLAWDPVGGGGPEFVGHLPDSGEEPSRGLATMELEGARYLWATAGSDHVYAAEARTGRGLFAFERPGTGACRGLCFGGGDLWIPEDVEGADRVHRVNVTRNPDLPVRGPRALRRLSMTIDTTPEEGEPEPGATYHYYSRPYAFEQLGCQGIWPETERVVDLSEAPDAIIRGFTCDPAGDVSSRQHMALVEYAGAPGRTCSSRYEIEMWTNRQRSYIYPHRVSADAEALEGMDYLADDPELFDLSDRATYEAFFERVAAHVRKKYGVEADLQNPYWAARDALEYIQDHYYYPSRPKGVPAAVDYDRQHYDANPGNLKIELSGRDYDRSQIIACSGTSVMMAGALRHLGFPARWLGTGTEQGAASWDSNGNGLLDEGERAGCTNGHRYTQVWLGDRYGWICFDATPSRPEHDDFDPPPPLRSQWRYMSRAAAGHMRDRRIVFNVGSGLFRPLFRDFEYDEGLAVNNDCGGDQRYNLQGRFDSPERWKLARHRISLENTCFLRDVVVSGPKEATAVGWRLAGDWDRDPDARISIHLQRVDPESGAARDVARLARGLPPDARAAVVDLSPHRAGHYRIILRKLGDPETGGCSEAFDLE